MFADRPVLTLATSGRVAEVQLRKALTAQGLKAGHGHVLMLLSEQGTISQQALHEALGVDPSMLVTMLNDLERDGLAERRRDQTDRRRHIVEITDQGAKLAAELHSAIVGIEAEIFADLDDDELAVLHRLLGRIRSTTDGDGCAEEH
jgi:DNA-binding MarR family transcriptional regulator